MENYLFFFFPKSSSRVKWRQCGREYCKINFCVLVKYIILYNKHVITAIPKRLVTVKYHRSAAVLLVCVRIIGSDRIRIYNITDDIILISLSVTRYLILVQSKISSVQYDPVPFCISSSSLFSLYKMPFLCAAYLDVPKKKRANKKKQLNICLTTY